MEKVPIEILRLKWAFKLSIWKWKGIVANDGRMLPDNVKNKLEKLNYFYFKWRKLNCLFYDYF